MAAPIAYSEANLIEKPPLDLRAIGRVDRDQPQPTKEEIMENFELIEIGEEVAITRADVIRAEGRLVGRLARRDDGSVYLSATESRTDYADTTLAEYGEADFLAPYFSLRLLRDIRFLQP